LKLHNNELSKCSASELVELINEWICGYGAERNRKILKRVLVDGVKYEAVAEEFCMSRQSVYKIVKSGRKILCEHIRQN
jgi:predicted DNA-binding protein YlxM (UPF0122 family)